MKMMRHPGGQERPVTFRCAACDLTIEDHTSSAEMDCPWCVARPAHLAFLTALAVLVAVVALLVGMSALTRGWSP